MSTTDLGPIELTFEVSCSPERAFALWTQRLDTWWPRGKRMSEGAADEVTFTFQAEVGGRIFERTADGVEHDWGRVLAVERPRRLVFDWHLMFDAEEATEVEVTFSPTHTGTRIDLVHRAWERLPVPVAEERRRRNRAGWAAIADTFAGFVLRAD